MTEFIGLSIIEQSKNFVVKLNEEWRNYIITKIQDYKIKKQNHAIL
jgi:hypothetical protein